MTGSESNLGALHITQSLLDAVEPGVTVFNSNFELVVWNKPYERMNISARSSIRKGLTLYENYRHIAARGIFGPGDPEELAKQRWEMALSGTSAPVEDLQATDGRTIEIRRYFLPGIGVAAVFTDVTQARQIENRARRVERFAQLGRVAGGLAHDFNNLLSVVIGSLEVEIKEGMAATEGVKLALEAANRGADLCRTSLALSATQAKREEVLSVSESLEEVARFIQRILPETIQVEVSLPAKDDFIRTDRTRLTGAILNLALNGRDAMLGGGQLTLEASREEQGELAITVTDQGIGMDEETLRRIREPLYSTKRAEGGSGLGLAEVRQFTEEAGGRMEISSKPGEGTRVRLYLPSVSKMPSKRGQGTALPGLSASVLLVEDEEPVRHTMEAMLRSLGASVVSTDSAARARPLSSPDFDVLITDYLLPDSDFNGADLAAFARKTAPEMAVLICSGYQDAQIAPRDRGIAVLPKPFTLERLHGALTQAVRP